MVWKKVIFGLSLLLSLIALAGCGAREARLQVEMGDFKFTPTDFEVPAGAKVTISANNTGTLEHEFVIMKLGTTATIPFDDDDEPNIYWEIEVEPGKSAVDEFTAPAEKGEYQVVCGTAGHMEQNMIGKLVVK
jgi:uncharacterized cupredoxin-like copper-binding protein